MKQGKTLNELAAEVVRQNKEKRDYLAPMGRLTYQRGENGVTLNMENGNGGYTFEPTGLFHNQVAEKLGIPQKYYDKCAEEQPGLLMENVNTWLSARKDQRIMLRTMDRRARAFLSDRYRPLDHFDLLESVLPEIQKHQWDIKSCELSDTKLYVKVVSTDIAATIKPGHVNVRDGGQTHTVHPGFVLSNSEVGLGMVKLEPTIHWEHCLNLAILSDAAMRRAHVGRRGAAGIVEGAGIEFAEEFFRDETRKADDKAFWMKVRDVVRAAIDAGLFARMVERFQEAAEIDLGADPMKAVEEVTERFRLNESENAGVLRHLIEGGDLSVYGLSGAVTRASQDVESYERATELERIGGDIIELPKTVWEEALQLA